MRKFALICSILSAILAVVVVATILPDTVPTHFNFRGEADSWGSKWSYVWMGLIPVAISVIYEVYRRKTPDAKNRKMEDKLIPLMALFFIPFLWLTMPLRGEQTAMDVRYFCGITLLLGVLMIVISNYMGKIRQNRYMGIKVPWVYKSEAIWNKTHRLGGFFGILGGAVIIISSIIALFNAHTAFAWCFGGVIAGIVLTVLVPTVYSAWLYHKLKKENKL